MTKPRHYRIRTWPWYLFTSSIDLNTKPWPARQIKGTVEEPVQRAVGFRVVRQLINQVEPPTPDHRFGLRWGREAR